MVFSLLMRNLYEIFGELEEKQGFSAWSTAREHPYANRHLVMYVRGKTGLGRNRIGISVSKKVGNSVVRHHLTRLNPEKGTACRKNYFILAMTWW